MEWRKVVTATSRRMTCGEALMHLLGDYGVDAVFGIPGEHTLELYRGIENSRVRHVLTRHEQGAGFMADGYGRVTGKPGVCTLITGPGVTNCTTPLAQAYADSVPMLLISSANRSKSLGKGWGCLHEITDQSAVTAPLTAFSALVRTPEDIPELIAQAFTVFHSRRPRPVHISVPLDLLGLPVEGGWTARVPPQRPVAPPASIDSAATLLAAARRPVILVGGGAQDAGDCVRRLCERLDAAVISSNAGKGVVPESHPLSLGGGLITKAVRDFLETADVVLSIGCEISETDSFEDYLTINGKLIRIDLDPSKFNDLYPATVAVQGDAGPSVEAIVRSLERRPVKADKGTAESLDAVRTRQAADLTAVERQHAKLLLELRSLLPPDTIMFGDIAQLVYTGSAVMPTDLPRTWFYPAGLGTLAGPFFCRDRVPATGAGLPAAGSTAAPRGPAWHSDTKCSPKWAAEHAPVTPLPDNGIALGTLGCALPGAIGAKIALTDRPVIVLGLVILLYKLLSRTGAGGSEKGSRRAMPVR